MAGRSRILTVKILTDAAGAQKGLTAATGKYAAFTKAIGKSSATTGTKAGDYLVGGIDKVLGTGLKIAGAAGAAILGTSLFKGFQRLNDIDQASAKLRGLGHSAGTVDRIMKNALASVKGTAFGLGEAAGTAAQLVAAGIKPGEQLERTLKGVADAATIGGTSMDDMGAIFAKVAAKNRLQADVINQMTARGIPVLQLLAKHYGTTAEQASKMVTRGEVDFAAFASAMNKGMAGAALESGNTMQGAWRNTLAALGRIGANLLQPIFDRVKGGLKGLPDLLEPLEGAATRIGRVLGDMLDWVQRNVGMLTTLGKIAGVVVGALLAFRVVVAVMQAYRAAMVIVAVAQAAYTAASYGAAGATYAQVAATNAQRIAFVAGAVAQKVMAAANWLLAASTWAVLGPILLVIAAIAALIVVVVLIVKNWSKVRAATAAVWQAILRVVQAAVAWLAAAAQRIAAPFVAAWQWVSGAASAVWAVVTQVAQVAAAVLMGVARVIALPYVLAFRGIQAIATFVFNNVIRPVVQAVVGFVVGIARTIAPPFVAGFNQARAVATAVFAAIRSAGQAAVSWIVSAGRTVAAPYVSAFNQARAVASSAFAGIRSIVASTVGAILAIARTIGSGFSSAFSVISSLASSVFGRLKSIATSALNAILAPIRAISSAFQAVVGWVQKVIDMIGKLAGAGGIISKIVGFDAPIGPGPFGGGFGPAGFPPIGLSAAGLSRGILPAAASAAPTLRAPTFAAAAAPVTVIQVDGGLDSGETIARRIRQILSDSDRRRGGVTVDRRVG